MYKKPIYGKAGEIVGYTEPERYNPKRVEASEEYLKALEDNKQVTKEAINTAFNPVPESLLYGDPVPLASSLHRWSTDRAREIYEDMVVGTSDVHIAPLGQLYEIKTSRLGANLPKIFVPYLAKGKSGYYYLRKLSRSDRKEYLKEMKLANAGAFPITEWLASGFEDFEEFLTVGFDWGNTSKGVSYWQGKADQARWWSRPILTASDIENLKI